MSLAKRRVFVFPAAELYGGFANTYDYGPLGVELKRNIREAWWRSMVRERDDVVGLDAALITHPRVWVASGHVATFHDPLADCKKCHMRWRVDHIAEGQYGEPKRNAAGELLCPNDGGELTEPRMFNLMFKTQVGTIADDENVAYLPPETAQGIFINFENVVTSMRRKLPFGIAQSRVSFRNEITPGKFIFRTLEFEQMEMEYFVPPEEGAKWFEYWCQERLGWYVDLGIPADQLRLRAHETEELSHYSAGTADVEFMYPWGWGELEGIANRTDYDLTQHGKFSGQDLSYFDQENDRRYIPHVIEPAAGADRATLAFLLAAYDEEEVPDAKGGTDKRTLLRLDPRLAPIKVAVLPLSKNEQLVPLAGEIADSLRRHFMIDVDVAGSIGKRYRRQDEVGTPLCVTIDFDSLEDRAVTVRDRDTMTQERIPIPELLPMLHERVG